VQAKQAARGLLKATLSVRLLHRFWRHGRSFSIKNRSKKGSKFNIVFLSFFVAFGTHLGAFWEAKIDPRAVKLGPRRLLKRYILKKVNFHETL